MLVPLPIGVSSNLDIDGTSAADGQAVSFVNFYVDRGGAFRTIPPLVPVEDLGTNAAVWCYWSQLFDTLVVVSAGRIWTRTSAIGTLTESTGAALDANARPTFTEDKTRIFIAAKSAIHMLNPSTGVITVLGASAPVNVTSLAYIGGYLKACGDTYGGGSVPGDTHYSDDVANDYAAWEVYNNESQPDKLQSIIVAYEQVYNVGAQTLEVTYVDGTVPFSRNRNAAQHFGTPAPGSVIFDGESLYYLSEVTSSRKIIKLSGGGAPTIISFPVDVPLEEFESVEDANAYVLAFKGQNFYCIDFPTANCFIDGQFWPSITLAYHIQKEKWLSFAAWDVLQGVFKSYTAKSFAYVQNWNLRLVGGNDGKLYKMADDEVIQYTVEPELTHKWRDDNSDIWKNPRTIKLGLPGITTPTNDQRQCGIYRNRQHCLTYAHETDSGELFKAEIKSGHIAHGADVRKRSNFYRYSLKRGSNQFVLNSIHEDVDRLRD